MRGPIVARRCERRSAQEFPLLEVQRRLGVARRTAARTSKRELAAMHRLRRLRLDRHDALDLDRDLVRQHDIADRRAGMPSSFTEHFDK